ncbi:hypothetical protein [Pseudoalteromonas umbrosa]|uniref:hypothetical protein n=1 Tax=Pseudoalteromonas umbrosa TaxID=3048489 RepID=UPI0024C2E26E|nr:hypothetical protein [Pseudoalteromonas sp. B95]MDK1290223.1 hypothetical protein [Pseudoalteromonas sp. B95]
MSAARLGDAWAGVCFAHKTPTPMVGVIVTGAATVSAEGMSKARFGDVVVGACGHAGLVVSSSSLTITEGSGAARLGDAVAGAMAGSIISSAATVLTT